MLPRPSLLAAALAVALAAACGRPSLATDADADRYRVVSVQKGKATWYEVPKDSLAARRGNPGEFTAAHDDLPLGTLVRVTLLKTGRSVLVRITDDGVGKRQSIDLAKGAAEKIGLVGPGRAKVKIEILERR